MNKLLPFIVIIEVNIIFNKHKKREDVLSHNVYYSCREILINDNIGQYRTNSSNYICFLVLYNYIIHFSHG